jgi:hypothetical protein
MDLYLVALTGTGSTAVVAVVATFVSSCVAALVAYLTKRSSDQASVAIADTTTRGQVEEEAFERAKSFYTDVIDRQAAEIRDLKARVGTCETSVGSLRRDVSHYKRVAQRLARAVYELRRELGDKAPRDPQVDEVVLDILGDQT